MNRRYVAFLLTVVTAFTAAQQAGHSQAPDAMVAGNWQGTLTADIRGTGV